MGFVLFLVPTGFFSYHVYFCPVFRVERSASLVGAPTVRTILILFMLKSLPLLLFLFLLFLLLRFRLRPSQSSSILRVTKTAQHRRMKVCVLRAQITPVLFHQCLVINSRLGNVRRTTVAGQYVRSRQQFQV